MARLGFSLFLIPWAVSKYAANSCLDRLNGCRNAEVHYLGRGRVFRRESEAAALGLALRKQRVIGLVTATVIAV